MRESLPGRPYVCFQTPKTYYNNLKILNIKFNNFTTINDYLSKLEEHTAKASGAEKDEYSVICQLAAKIGMNIQKEYISQKYAWLNFQSGSKYLMMAHRICATNTFPVNIFISKYLTDRLLNIHTFIYQLFSLYGLRL